MAAGNDYETAHLNVAKGAELAHKNPGAAAPQYGAPTGLHFKLPSCRHPDNSLVMRKYMCLLSMPILTISAFLRQLMSMSRIPPHFLREPETLGDLS